MGGSTLFHHFYFSRLPNRNREPPSSTHSSDEELPPLPLPNPSDPAVPVAAARNPLTFCRSDLCIINHDPFS